MPTTWKGEFDLGPGGLNPSPWNNDAIVNILPDQTQRYARADKPAPRKFTDILDNSQTALIQALSVMLRKIS